MIQYPESDKRQAKIFISHADEDWMFADALITLITAIGIDAKESIVCTSKSGLGFKVGKDWVAELKRCFTDFRIYVIIIHSSHYYSSVVCLNEMGAAWVIDCPIFSFLVNGFKEISMTGVLTSNHQCVLVGRKDIEPNIDQLKNEISTLFGLSDISEEDWKKARSKFVEDVTSLPADKGIVKELFDIDQIEHVHIQEITLWDSAGMKEELNIRWSDILKTVEQALRIPHTEEAIKEALRKDYPGIIDDDCKMIIDKLHQYGLAETYTVTSEYDGISVAWCFTEKGRDAYERTKNYHLQLIYQERDKTQIIELMNYFNTDAMDEYLKEGPEYVSDVLLLSADAWRDIIGSSTFQIFNPSLLEVLKLFYELFFKMMDHGECYVSAGDRRNRLVQKKFGLINEQYEDTIKWLYNNMAELRKRFNTFIGFIKTQYPDIYLRETNEHFMQVCRGPIIPQ